MENQSYHSRLTLNIGMDAAFEAVQKRVNAWWTPDLEGRSEKLGDEFTVRFGKTWVNFKITAMEPGKKIIWLVTGSCLPWLTDQGEWTGTSIVWDFQTEDDQTLLEMTHEGLVPQVECYERCREGWNFFFLESLQQLLITGRGMPNRVRGEE